MSLSPKQEQLFKQANKHIPGGVNSPVRAFNGVGGTPVFIEKAIAEGATYVAFGAVYATSTKPEAGNVGVEVVQQAKQKFKVPICAIGGLTVENSQVVIEAGASLCAVISDILGRSTAEIPVRVNAWAKLFA